MKRVLPAKQAASVCEESGADSVDLSGVSLFSPLFKSASEGKVAWYGSPSDRYALIHCDDLADLYLRAAEKSQLVCGQIFDAANDFTENADDLLRKLVEVSGAQGPHEYIKASNCE